MVSSDTNIRDLERRAAQGDAEAEGRLNRLRERANQGIFSHFIGEVVVAVCDRYTYKGKLVEKEGDFILLENVEYLYNHSESEITDSLKLGKLHIINARSIENLMMAKDLAWADKYSNRRNQDHPA